MRFGELKTWGINVVFLGFAAIKVLKPFAATRAFHDAFRRRRLKSGRGGKADKGGKGESQVGGFPP